MSMDLRNGLIDEFSYRLKHKGLREDPDAPETAADAALDVLRAYLANTATVLLVDATLSHALLERAEANHRGTTGGPTVTDMARRVLERIAKDSCG